LSIVWPHACAPDLKPVEAFSSHAKIVALANSVPDDLDRLRDAVLNVVDKTYFKSPPTIIPTGSDSVAVELADLLSREE